MLRSPARFRRAVVVAGLFAPLAAAAQDTAPPARPTIAVMYFNNGALLDHAEYEPLRAGVADILISELQVNPAITVVERDALHRILAEQNLVTEQRVDPETAVRVGRLLGAQHMVVGGFLIDRSGTMRLDARAVNVETSRVEHVETVTGQSDALLELIGQLAQKLNTGLRLPARPRQTAPPPAPSRDAGSAAPKVSPFKAMLTYARALTEDDGGRRATAVSLYRQFLRETAPDYAVPQRRRAEDRVRALSGSE